MRSTDSTPPESADPQRPSTDPDPPEPAGRQWPKRLLYVLWVTLAQVLTIVVVYALFLQLLPGWGPFLVGAPVALLAAALVGSVVAARLRLPLYGLYALPVLMAVFGVLAVIDLVGIALPKWPIFIGGNVLIALATARRPLRAGMPRADTGGVPR